MDLGYYSKLAERGINKEDFTEAESKQILEDPSVELLPLLNAAYEVRKHYHGKDVNIHILNNAENGHCPEDCTYCAQGKNSESGIDEYPMKKPEEILAEAKRAYEGGAFRYCMVFSGREPSMKRTMKMAGIIQQVKDKYKLEVCVSAGLMDKERAQILRDAGCDRLNHNLNTSESFYPVVCSTHTFQDRMNTLKSARSVGLEVCSGMIIGMGEEKKDIVEVAHSLRDLQAKSIPVNFLVPIEGNVLDTPTNLSPEYCLRVLSLFRFLNPEAELRAAAGREGHLRSLEAMCLYPANSIFLDGYLNTKGSNAKRVLQMIKDAGFTIKSDYKLEEVLSALNEEDAKGEGEFAVDGNREYMKTLSDLKPTVSV